MKPGWVEFAPVWRRPPAWPADDYTDDEIAEVFRLARANLRGELSDIETEKKFIRLRRKIETKRKQGNVRN